MPRLLDAFEDVFSSIVEGEAPTRCELSERRRDEDLGWTCDRHHAGTDMNADTSHRGPDALYLADVKPNPDIDPQLLNRPDQLEGAAKSIGSRLERCEEPVASRVDLLAFVRFERSPDEVVVATYEFSPSTIVEFACHLRRANDVREEDRGELPRWLGLPHRHLSIRARFRERPRPGP